MIMRVKTNLISITNSGKKYIEVKYNPINANGNNFKFFVVYVINKILPILVSTKICGSLLGCLLAV